MTFTDCFLQTPAMRSMCANCVAAGTRPVKACPVMLGPTCAKSESERARLRAAPLSFSTGSWKRRTSNPSAVSNRKNPLPKVPLDHPPNVSPLSPRLLPASGLKPQTIVYVFCAARSLRTAKAWAATHALT